MPSLWRLPFLFGLSSSANHKTVISTEAAHALIVSSEAEKSASCTLLSPATRVRALAIAFLVVIPKGLR
jgi:hypothetical protein